MRPDARTRALARDRRAGFRGRGLKRGCTRDVMRDVGNVEGRLFADDPSKFQQRIKIHRARYTIVFKSS